MFISLETSIPYFITFIADVIKIQAPFTDFNSTTAPTTETTPPQTPTRKMSLDLSQFVYFGFAPEDYLVLLHSTDSYICLAWEMQLLYMLWVGIFQFHSILYFEQHLNQLFDWLLY